MECNKHILGYKEEIEALPKNKLVSYCVRNAKYIVTYSKIFCKETGVYKISRKTPNQFI